MYVLYSWYKTAYEDIHISCPLAACSFPSFWVGLVIEVAKLLQELFVGLPKLQAVQPIPRVRRQLNCREIPSALRHRVGTHRIMYPYSSTDCKLDGRGVTIGVGFTKVI